MGGADGGGKTVSDQQSDLVNWDGILSPQERSRIIARLHSAFGAVGAAIPDRLAMDGKSVPLRELIFDYLGNAAPGPKELEAADELARALERKVAELEMSIRDADLTEKSAIGLMKEALGVLRALQELRSVRGPGRIGPARLALLQKVDDERRWLQFVGKVKL